MTASRRDLLIGGALAALGSTLPGRARATPPTVTNPRATDGDQRFEPDWDERFRLTVGRSDADLIGQDDRVLQAAVDYVRRMGGGTVQIGPGVYTLRAAIELPSSIRLVGHGADTILTRGPSAQVPLAADSDWYDQEITLSDAAPFRVGDSVALLARNPHHGGSTVIKRKIVARAGNRLKLNDGLRENLWISGQPHCASLFPLLTSERQADITIEALTLDGNRQQVENFNGNYGGCIFLQDCNRITLRSVEARNYNGDGISFQICHDVLVESCHSHDNSDLGIHPGSGSQRPIIRQCRMERNGLGLFWCWGVKFGLAEDNRITDNLNYGMSIGHNDTDNLIRRNHISGSGKVGILFRDENRGLDFWANRNRIEHNRIEDSGGDEGIAIDIQGQTKDVVLANNQFIETRGAARRVGVRIGPQAERIDLVDNQFQGLHTNVLQLTS